MELKYKAKRKDNNEFITGCLIIDEISDKYYISLSVEESEKTGEEGCLKVVSCEVYKETVSVYTGVKDINKKESYLGDIVKEPGNKYDYGIIEKESESNNMFITWWYPSNSDCKLWNSMKLKLSYIKQFEVIGNIYTNPDMIKKEG